MAVTKRIRFEILRRDNSTCTYCGAKSPDVKLVVDHVVPKALGGTDEVTNLTTACEPCNNGKASVAPDSPIAADVKAGAIEHANRLQAAYAVLVERIGLETEYADSIAPWCSFTLPDDWRITAGRWYRMGVPVEIPVYAAEIASAKFAYEHLDRFRYLCGIVWNTVSAVDGVTAEKAALAGRFMTEQQLEDYGIEYWNRGWDIGWRRAKESIPVGEFRYTEAELNGRLAEAFHDGRAAGLALSEFADNPDMREEIESLQRRYAVMLDSPR
jgi:HNH endonuclease